MGTKCIRVSSTADARTVVDILIEKFRPDMKMLALPNYVLYEIHSNGFERMLAAEESPLLCQLAWNKDDREGRFLLKSANEKTQVGSLDWATIFQNISYPQTNFKAVNNI